MLVTIAASGASSRKVPSLSSASTTSHSPWSYAAFVPDLVDVAADEEAGMPARGAQHEGEHRRRRRLAVAARDGDRAPRRDERAQRLGAPQHGDAALVGRDDLGVGRRDRARHDDRVAPSGDVGGRRDRRGCRRRARRDGSSVGESLRSDPLTVCPMRASTSAIALIPAPPTPTTWMRLGVARSSAGSGAAAGEGSGPGTGRPPRPGRRRERPRRDGPATARRRSWRRGGRARRAARRASRRGAAPSSWASGMATAAPAATSASALRVWWSPGAPGQRHEDRGDAGRSELGDGHGAGAAHRDVGVRVQALHVLFVGDERRRRARRPVAGVAARADAQRSWSRAPATWRTATSARRRHRSARSSDRVVQRRGAEAAAEDAHERPLVVAIGAVARPDTAAISARTGLPVSTAPRSGVPGSDTAARAAEAHREPVRQAGRGVLLVHDDGDAPQPRGQDARNRRDSRRRRPRRSARRRPTQAPGPRRRRAGFPRARRRCRRSARGRRLRCRPATRKQVDRVARRGHRLRLESARRADEADRRRADGHGAPARRRPRARGRRDRRCRRR